MCVSRVRAVLSSIVVESYKKLILVSLIHRGEAPTLPLYTSTIVSRALKTLCKVSRARAALPIAAGQHFRSASSVRVSFMAPRLTAVALYVLGPCARRPARRTGLHNHSREFHRGRLGGVAQVYHGPRLGSHGGQEHGARESGRTPAVRPSTCCFASGPRGRWPSNERRRSMPLTFAGSRVAAAAMVVLPAVVAVLWLPFRWLRRCRHVAFSGSRGGKFTGDVAEKRQAEDKLADVERIVGTGRGTHARVERSTKKRRQLRTGAQRKQWSLQGHEGHRECNTRSVSVHRKCRRAPDPEVTKKAARPGTDP